MCFDITTCPFEVNKQIMQLHYLFHYRIASEQVSQIKLIHLETFNYCLASDHRPGFRKLSFMIHKVELERILWAFPGKKLFLRVCFAIKMSQSILHEPQDPGTIWFILYLQFTPRPWLAWIRFTQISLKRIYKKFLLLT